MKSRDDKPPRAWNSSLPAPSKPMNRGPGPKRSARLASEIAPSRKPIRKIGKQKAKREARNKAYYASLEWRAKRKAVFERDGFQCVEILEYARASWRCPNRGEIVNGKQTARGLVAEETGYQHRGIPDAIDRIKTRCKDCDRRCTPLERANHAQGFSGRRCLTTP